MVVFVIISVLIAILSIVVAIRCVWIDWCIKRYTDEYVALRDTKMTHKDTLKHHNRIKKELKELKKQTNG
jgi:5-bromo-4-chloroindolyl phosphate hydrolysis protein